MNNIDRLVNKLNRRIEETYSLEIQQGAFQEGINIWKGKRILSVDQWLKVIASLENNKVVFDLSKGFDYFPDSTTEIIFEFGVEGSVEYYKEIPKEEFDKWFNDYLDLLAFKKNTKLGSMMCKNCLLSPHKDCSGLLIGVHKIVTKSLQKKPEGNTTILNDHNQRSKNLNENGPIYPCNVLNYFSCPYEYKDNNKKFEHGFDSDTEYLFELEQITRFVDISLLKASALTQSNETLYEIDIESNTMKEIQTLNNGKQVVVMKWSPIEKGKKRILEKSVIPVRNKDDVLEILKDKDKLDKILRQGLSREDYGRCNERILNCFYLMRNNLDMNFNYRYDINESKQKFSCYHCKNFANICCKKKNTTWSCIKHWQTVPN